MSTNMRTLAFTTMALLRLHPVAVASEDRLYASSSQLEKTSAAQNDESAERQNARFLQHVCARDSSMVTDAVWYELDITLWTRNELECSSSEWGEFRNLFHQTVSDADLWDHGLNIVSLNQHFCNTEPAHGRNLELRDDDSMLDVVDHDAALRNLELRDDNSPFSFYHFFFRAAGRCLMCRPDDLDRRLRQRSVPALRGKSEFSNEEEARKSKQAGGSSSSQQHRRRMGCGGCFNLDFSKYANGTHITGTPYLDTWEYFDSHGVRIRAYGASENNAYTPNNQARIFDTSNPIEDQDLGSPNKRCPGGGPGRGVGGKPTNKNGVPNPGANCEGEKNVIIIQESDSPIADDNRRGGKLMFNFRYPVTVESVGLMDIDEGAGDYVIVDTRSRGSHRHHVNGFGSNSIENVILNMEDTWRVRIMLPGSGAVRYIKFCHECGEEERQREREIHEYYPPDGERSYENQGSVYHFNSLLQTVDADVSALLQTAINENHNLDPSSCLYNANPHVQAHLITSTPGLANDCHQH